MCVGLLVYACVGVYVCLVVWYIIKMVVAILHWVAEKAKN